MMVCNKCLKELVEGIPQELWPVIEDELHTESPEVEEHLEESEPEQDPEPEKVFANVKVYPCDYCGEVFTRPGDKGNHVKSCTKNPKNIEKDGK